MRINETTGLKICSKCKGEFTAENYSKCGASTDGFDPLCKSCRRESNRVLRERNKLRNGLRSDTNPNTGKDPNVKSKTKTDCFASHAERKAKKDAERLAALEEI